jgi:hypothetical protein
MMPENMARGEKYIWCSTGACFNYNDAYDITTTFLFVSSGGGRIASYLGAYSALTRLSFFVVVGRQARRYAYMAAFTDLIIHLCIMGSCISAVEWSIRRGQRTSR